MSAHLAVAQHLGRNLGGPACGQVPANSPAREPQQLAGLAALSITFSRGECLLRAAAHEEGRLYGHPCRNRSKGQSGMTSDGTWYVLIEQDDEVGHSDGHNLSHWQLAAEHKARDEEHARVWAKELLQTHLPARWYDFGHRPHTRRIYQLTECSWLVASRMARSPSTSASPSPNWWEPAGSHRRLSPRDPRNADVGCSVEERLGAARQHGAPVRRRTPSTAPCSCP